MQPTNDLGQDLGLWNHIRRFKYSRELLMLDVYCYQNEVKLSRTSFENYRGKFLAHVKFQI